MDRRFLVTYHNGKEYTYDWLDDENEANEWLSENKDKYTFANIVEVVVIREVYNHKEGMY